MKRLSKLLVFVVAFVMAFSTLFACQPQQPGPSTEPVTPSITLDKTIASMDLYETLTLTATKENLTGDVVWSSSDNTKATVENGVVTSLAEGTVTITAAVGETSATCQVTIVSSGARPALSLNVGDTTIKVGDEITVTPTLKYKGNTVTANYTYKSQNSEVVTVNNGKVTAVGIGSSDVTVTANYYGFTTSKKIKVTVTADVVFGLSETEVLLGTSANAGYVTSATVTGNVIENGQPVANPTITWDTQDANVATVAGGVITATGVGETIIEATYVSQGQEFTLYLPVVVEKPVLEATFEVAPIDLNANAEDTITLDITSALEGTGYVTTDIVKIVDVSDNDTVIPFEIDGTALKIAKANIAAGQKSLNLEFDVVAYSIEMLVATKIITTATELDNLQAYSLTDKNTKVVWDRSQVTDPNLSTVPSHITKVYQYHGYFLLGADIQYNKTAPAWCGRANNGGVDGIIPGGEFSPNEGNVCGFHGTFDGNGHAIIGLQSSGANEGFVGTLGTNGVIKNVAFLNAKCVSNSAAVASLCYGTIENVFVQGEIATTNAAWGAHGIVATKGNNNGRFINVIADVTNAATAANTALFAGFSSGATYTNCYAIGTGAVFANTAAAGVGDVARFDNYGALAQSEVNLDAWDAKYWDTTSGVPVFKAYLNYVNTDAAQFVGVSDEYTVEKGVETTIALGIDPARYTVVSLKNEVAGISLNNNVITVGADFAETATVTVQAYSIFAKDTVIEKAITIVPMVITRLNDKVYAQYDMGGTDPYTLTLAQLEGKTVTGAAIGTSVIDFTQEGTTLTFDAEDYKAIKQHGEVEIMISGADFAYLVKVLNITKIITTADELLSLEELAPNKYTVTWSKWTDETTEENYDGYFVLGNNIDLGDRRIKVTNHTGGAPARIWDNADTGAGFSGTFDGQGYTINGGVYGQGGLFGYLWKTGVIKNVAFTNATVNSETYASVIGISLWGTMKDVLITVKDSQLNGGQEFGMVAMQDGTTFKSENVIVYEDAAYSAANAGKVSTFINHHSDGAGTYLETYVFTDGYVGQQKESNTFSGYVEPIDINTTLADTGIDLSKWSSIWDMTGERAIFNSMKAIILEALEDVNEIELTVGKEYTFPAYGGYTFNVTTESDKATTEGSTIKIADNLTESVTFTATLAWASNSSVKKDITVKVLVTNKHDFTNEPINIELYDGVATQAITVTGLTETIKSVTLNDVAVDYTLEGEVITLDKANLAGGVHTFIVLTENNEYIYKFNIVNKIITTKDEFLNWIEGGQYVKDNGAAGRTGTILLGADINLDGKSINPAMGAWGAGGWEQGWSGTFDGCGYTISNYKINGQDKGLFRVIHATGVFKNVTIKDVTIAGSSGAITCAAYGTIENVTVIGKIVASVHNANVATGLFASNSNQPATAVFRNCVGILTEYSQTENEVAGIIAGAYATTSPAGDMSATYENVIGINAHSGQWLVPVHGYKCGWLDNVANTEATYAVKNYQGKALYSFDTETVKTFANAAEYAEWAKTADASWDDAKASVAEYAATLNFAVTGAPTGSISKGESVSLSAPFAIWTLKDAPAGVEISANGVVTTPADIEPCTFTVVATSAFDATKVVEVVITVSSAETDNTLITNATALDSLATEATQTTELSQAFEGTVTGVEYNGQVITEGITLDGTTLTVATAILGQIGSGTHTFTVVTTAKKYTNVQISVVTVIRTAEQLVNLLDYAPSKEPITYNCGWSSDVNDYRYGGHFVLGNNIDLTGYTMAPFGELVKTIDTRPFDSNSATCLAAGFYGTFDGKGYTIFGGTYDCGGLFRNVAEGAVIKNVAFVNATISGRFGAIFGNGFRGTLDNVLIEVTAVEDGYAPACRGAIASCEKGIYNNVIVYASDATPGTSTFWAVAESTWGTEGSNSYVFTDLTVKDYAGFTELSFATTLTAAGVDATTFNEYWDMTGDKATFKTVASAVTGIVVKYINSLDNTTIIPGQSLTLKNAVGAGFTLTTESDKVVIDGMTIAALEVAEQTEVEITATWNGDGTTSATFTVVIPAIKQDSLGAIAEYYLDNASQVFAVEIASLEGKTIASITVDGVAFDSYTFEGKTLTFDATAFRALNKHGVVAVYVNAGDYKVDFTVTNVTKVIRTAEELLALETYAPNCEEVTWNVWEGNTTSYKYDGYFVLGNSIDLGTTAVAFPITGNSRVWKESIESSSPGEEYSEAGFHGTFDGRGYTINGGIYGIGGLFGNIWKTGVIKNVALENVSLTNDYRSAVIGVSYHGYMENVYVHVTANAHQPNASEYALLATNSGANARMTNVFLYDESAKAEYAEGTLNTKFSSFINHSSGGPTAGNFNNVYVFTHNNVGYISNNGTAVTNHEEKYLAAGVKKFALATTLAEAEIDVTAFGAYWDMTGDRAVFKSTANLAIDVLKAYDGARLVAGESITIAGEGYTFTTESAAVTINGNTITANTVETETIVTINATHGELTGSFTVVVPALIKVELGKVAEWDMSTDTDYSVTIPELEGKNVTKVTVNGVQVTNVAIADNTITFNWTEYEAALTAHGETTVSIDANPYILEFQVLNITKVITTKAELLAMRDYAFSKKSVTWIQWANETTSDFWNGYYVLGDHIDLGTTVISNITYFEGTPSRNWAGSNKQQVGFAGTFDGRGYTIVNGIYGSGGLFGYVYDTAVIKNVALLNVNVNSDARACVLGISFFGTLENVLMDVKSYTRVGGEESVLGMNTGADVVFRNVVLYDETVYTGMNGGQSSFFNHANSSDLMGTIENVFVFTNHTAGNGNGKPHAENWAKAGVVTKKPTATLAEAGVDATKFDSAIWNMTGDKAAFVKVYVSAKTEIEIPYTLNVDVKNATFTVDLAELKDVIGDTFTVEVDGKAINDFTNEGGVLTFNTAVLAGVWGNKKVVIESATAKVTATLLVYRSINNVNEFVNMYSYLTLTSGTANAGGSTYDGYLVLTADIDAAGKNMSFGGWTDNGWSNKFTGTFDGQNHAIYNLTENDSNGGIFSNASATAVFKNVRFYNASVGGNTGLVATDWQGLIENVFVSGKITGGGAAWAVTSMVITKGNTATLRNCAVVLEDNKLAAGSYSGIVFGEASNTIKFENIITVQLGGTKTANYNLGRIPMGAENYVDNESDTVKAFGSAEAYLAWLTSEGATAEWAKAPVALISAYVAGLVQPTAASYVVEPGATATVSAANAVWVKTSELAEAIEGVTYAYDAETGKGTLTVADTVAAGTVITVKNTAHENTTATATFIVCENAVITLDKEFYIDVTAGDNLVIDLAGKVTGEFASAKTSGGAALSATVNGDVITIDSAAFALGESVVVLRYEEKSGDVVVKVTEVNVTVVKATMVISNSAELNKFADLGEGYVVLDTDFTYTGIYTRKAANFEGTFDGRGHSITNFKTNTGLVLMLAHVDRRDNGVIKNLILLNAVSTGNVLLTNSGAGQIEDVYISIGAENTAGGILTADNYGARRIRRVVVDFQGATAGYSINGYHEGYGIAESVVQIAGAGVVGTKWTDKGGEDGACVKLHYATWADMQAAQPDVSAWDNAFWDVVNGILVPASLKAESFTLTKSAETVLADSTVVIGGAAYATYALNSEATEAGVAINGNAVTVPATAAGVEVTVTATAIYNAEVTGSITFVVAGTVTLEKTIDVVLTNETFTLNLTGVKGLGALESVSVNGTEFATKNLEGGILTLDTATFGALYGEQEVIVKAGSIVKAPVVVITKVFTTAEDLLGWWDVVGFKAEDRTTYGAGYYALGADIAFNNTWMSRWNWTDKCVWNDGGGFQGVFDGRGYTIDGLTVSGAQGMFGCIGKSAVIKDVAFTNANTSSQSGFFAQVGGGTFENVYLQIKKVNAGSKINGSGLFWIAGGSANGTIKNCFVDIAEVASNFVEADANNPGVLGRFTGAVNNVIVITQGVQAVDGAYAGNTETLYTYNTRADMAAATNWQAGFANWDATIWTTDADGLPVFAKKEVEEEVVYDSNVVLNFDKADQLENVVWSNGKGNSDGLEWIESFEGATGVAKLTYSDAWPWISFTPIHELATYGEYDRIVFRVFVPNTTNALIYMKLGNGTGSDYYPLRVGDTTVKGQWCEYEMPADYFVSNWDPADTTKNRLWFKAGAGVDTFYIDSIMMKKTEKVNYDSNVVLNFDSDKQFDNIYYYEGTAIKMQNVTWLEEFEGETGVAKFTVSHEWPWMALAPVHNMSKYARYDRLVIRAYVEDSANALKYIKIFNDGKIVQTPIEVGATTKKGQWYDYEFDAAKFNELWTNNLSNNGVNRIWFQAVPTATGSSVFYIDSITMKSSTDFTSTTLSAYATLDATTAAGYTGFEHTGTYVDAAAVAADSTLPAIPAGENGYAKVTAKTNAYGVIEFRADVTATYKQFAAADYIEFKYFAPGEDARRIYIHNYLATTAFAGEWNTVRIPLTAFNAGGSWMKNSLEEWYNDLAAENITLVNFWDLGKEVDATIYLTEIRLVAKPRNTELGDKYVALDANNFKVNDGTAVNTTFDEKAVVKLTGGTWANIYINPGKTVGELQAYDKIVITMYVEGEVAMQLYSQDTIYSTANRVVSYGTSSIEPGADGWTNFPTGQWITVEIPVAHATQLFGQWSASATATMIVRGKAFTAIYVSDVSCVKNA